MKRKEEALETVQSMCADGNRWPTWKAARFEVIDLFVPLWFDNTYVMPPVVAQRQKGFMYSTQQMTLRAGAAGRWEPLVDADTPRGTQLWRSSDYVDAGLSDEMPPTGGPPRRRLAPVEDPAARRRHRKQAHAQRALGLGAAQG